MEGETKGEIGREGKRGGVGDGGEGERKGRVMQQPWACRLTLFLSSTTAATTSAGRPMRSWLLAAAAAASRFSTSMGSRAVYSALHRRARQVKRNMRCDKA